MARELVYRSEFAVGFSLRNYVVSRERFRSKLSDLDAEKPPDPNSSIGAISRAVLEHLDPAAVVEVRRSNFTYWLEHLDRLRPRYTPILECLPEGVCPHGFPVLAGRRDDLRRHLYRSGIAVRVYWDALPSEIDCHRFPDSAYLRDHILVLPVHQSLSTQHLDKVLGALDQF